MALFQRKNGSASNVIRLKIFDSTVATGAGKTGLTSASAGLIISTIADNEATATAYTVAGSTIETITTLGTFAAPTATKCRFKEVDATNHPGLYELQFADARFAVANSKGLTVTISGATGAAQCDAVIQLTGTDVDDAIHGGLTALPNTACTTNASLITSGTGTAQLNVAAGLVTLAAVTHTGAVIPTVSAVTGLTASNLDATITSRMAIYAQPTGFLAATFPTGMVANTTNITAGTIATVTTLTNLPAIPINWLTGTGIDATAVTKIQTGLATSAQIPASFTAATFVSPGVFATAALANAPTGGSAPSAATIATAVWQDLLESADFTTVASIGKLLKDDVDAQLSLIAAKTTNLPAAPAGVPDIPTAVQNADALLGRNIGGGSSTGRLVKESLYFLRNKWTVAGGTLTVYATDDTTPAWSSVLTTTAGDPVSTSDPV